MDEALAEEATRLAAKYRVRRADAVYAAVAWRYGATLVTRDRQQLEWLLPALPVLNPAEALAQLDERAAHTCSQPLSRERLRQEPP